MSTPEPPMIKIVGSYPLLGKGGRAKYSNDVVRTMATAELPPDEDSGEDCPANWMTQQQSHAGALSQLDDEPLMKIDPQEQHSNHGTFWFEQILKPDLQGDIQGSLF